MLSKIAAGVAFLSVFVLAPSRAAAQGNPEPAKTTQTITGCLHTGDAESKYKLATKDGVWNLSASHELKIGRQINHTVTVRGTVVESFDTKTADKESNHRGIFEVSKITAIKNSCAD